MVRHIKWNLASLSFQLIILAIWLWYFMGIMKGLMIPLQEGRKGLILQINGMNILMIGSDFPIRLKKVEVILCLNYILGCDLFI